MSQEPQVNEHTEDAPLGFVSPETLLVTTHEAAMMLHVGTTTIKRWANDGLMQCIKTIGGHRRFLREDIERLISNPVFAAAITNQIGVLKLPVSVPSPPGGSQSFTTRQFLDALRSPTAKVQLVRSLLGERRALCGSWWRVANELQLLIAEPAEVAALARVGPCTVLERALALWMESMPLPTKCPRCLFLATAEQRSAEDLSLATAELCAREAGLATSFVDFHTPLGDVLELVRGQVIRLLVVSSFDLENANLAPLAERLGNACALGEVTLVLTGPGAWPEQPSYGMRIRSLDGLRHIFAATGT